MEKNGKKKQFQTLFSGPPGPFSLPLFTAPGTHHKKWFILRKNSISAGLPPQNSSSNWVILEISIAAFGT